MKELSRSCGFAILGQRAQYSSKGSGSEIRVYPVVGGEVQDYIATKDTFEKWVAGSGEFASLKSKMDEAVSSPASNSSKHEGRLNVGLWLATTEI